MNARITCPRYGCGVIQTPTDDPNGSVCVNCGSTLLTPDEVDRDRQSIGLLAALTLIAGLTWYITQKAM
jgi:hypothetical protein